MQIRSLREELSRNSYPGRGIILGRMQDGNRVLMAYFIMGRSQNSRNRIFVREGEGIRTQAFDPSKLEDPSLIIYAPVRKYENRWIVTNGDQTDTIYNGFLEGRSFAESLFTRSFEPDAPNYTPRISGLLELVNEDFQITLSILKSQQGDPSQCQRFFYHYDKPRSGEAFFIHTYQSDGDPLPSYEGEPTLLALDGDLNTISQEIWESLDDENKVSLFVRSIDLRDGSQETRIFNRNEERR